MLPYEPEPESVGVERQCHRQREIGEPEMKRIAVRDRQREQGGRGDAAMHLARDPEQPAHRQRRDRHHDQLDRKLNTEQPPERLDQQVDAEIADQLPVERSEEHTSELQSIMSTSYDVFSL